MPKKSCKIGHKTTSTSESEIERCDHNFTNALDKKNMSLKVKRNSK